MDKPATKDSLTRRERDRARGSDTLLSRARALRRQASDAEYALWKHLRGRRLKGYKFRRQVVIEPYIVDFLCLETKLIIEADGGQHVEQMAYDARRTATLEGMGYKIMRFWNNEILGELQSVLEQIESALIEDSLDRDTSSQPPHPETPHPSPLPEGEGERPEGEGERREKAGNADGRRGRGERK
jgi:very-short-patch-repair endonuclease